MKKFLVDDPVCRRLNLHTSKGTNRRSVISAVGLLIWVEWYVQLRERRAISVENQTIFPLNARIVRKGKSSTNGGFGGGSKTKMAHITIGNVQTSHRRRGSPTISLTVSRGDDADRVTTIQATPDPGAEVTVGGRDVMEAIGVTEEDLATSSFDLVMADRSTPLLSIGQRDIRVRYGDRDARITVVFCPEIQGMLVCRVDCVSLDILHKEYPKPLSTVRSVLVGWWGHLSPPETQKEEIPTLSEPVLRDVYIPLEPKADKIAAIELAIVARFSDVFDQEGGLRQMAGTDMVIQLRDDAVPYYVNGARSIAFDDRPEVKGLLDELVAKKVIEPVSDASEWAAPLVVIRNAKTGKLRLCVDQTRLNRFVMRPVFYQFGCHEWVFSDTSPSIQPAFDGIHDAMGPL